MKPIIDDISTEIRACSFLKNVVAVVKRWAFPRKCGLLSGGMFGGTDGLSGTTNPSLWSDSTNPLHFLKTSRPMITDYNIRWQVNGGPMHYAKLDVAIAEADQTIRKAAADAEHDKRAAREIDPLPLLPKANGGYEQVRYDTKNRNGAFDSDIENYGGRRMKPIIDDISTEWDRPTMSCPLCGTIFMMWEEPHFCPGCGERFGLEKNAGKTETCCICGKEFASDGSAYCSWSCLEQVTIRAAKS
jgi:hypothetical protein